MGEEDMEIVNIPDNVTDSDDIVVLYAVSPSTKKGSSKMDAIPVDNYPLRTKRVIDLSRVYSYYDDDVQLLEPISKSRARVYKGESSNSKLVEVTESRMPLTFNCEICADEKPTSGAFRVTGCSHTYCNECIGRYVASKLQDNISAINCPVLGCTGFLDPHSCRSILPKQVFDRWGDALCEALILASEKFYCPYKDCSALLIADMQGDTAIVIESECPDCNRLFCARCRVPWHSGITCEDFKKLKEDERSNDDIMLMKLAKSQKWMRCSKCKFYVEKIDGCLFMKCRCGYSFCYNCGAPLTAHYCPHCKH